MPAMRANYLSTPSPTPGSRHPKPLVPCTPSYPPRPIPPPPTPSHPTSSIPPRLILSTPRHTTPDHATLARATHPNMPYPILSCLVPSPSHPTSTPIPPHLYLTTLYHIPAPSSHSIPPYPIPSHPFPSHPAAYHPTPYQDLAGFLPDHKGSCTVASHPVPCSAHQAACSTYPPKRTADLPVDHALLGTHLLLPLFHLAQMRAELLGKPCSVHQQQQ